MSRGLNALQQLWSTLGDLLPGEIIAELQRQYAQNAAADRRHSQYRNWQRREREALSILALFDEFDHPGTHDRGRKRLEQARAWLELHQDWRPE
jgi:hypothetical protein